MSKRTATNNLNQDNWDQEEESEEPGVFKAASSEVLQSRVIRTAKRRMRAPENETKPSPFSGFSGFGSATSTSTTKSPFSFLNQVKSTGDKSNAQNGTDQGSPVSILPKDAAQQSKTFSSSPFLNVGQKNDSISSATTDKTNVTTATPVFKPFEHIFKASPKTQDKEEDKKKTKNLDLLRDLNLSCSSWIAEHLEKNPYCILTPIFKDYKKHLDELNLNESDINCAANDNVKKDDKPAESDTIDSKAKTEPVKTFNFNKEETTDSNQDEKTNAEKEKPGEFKLGGFQPVKPFNLQFGSGSTSFGSTSSTFSLNNAAAKPINTDAEANKDDEESEPPKNEFVPVVEEDSIFDIKCKVFVKKDGNFVSRGVGTLFLKPVKDSSKTQAVVRAHTSLGNILLNILLAPGMPIQKTGKNNAMIVCIPTPEAQPPPVPVLIRVKTSEECDTLIKKLEECRDA